ncbi:MAG: hypothetical protein C0511_17185 [Hyphomicrobium sp.]|nr:hypothetical protein [Hyphomicrobium sp.]
MAASDRKANGGKARGDAAPDGMKFGCWLDHELSPSPCANLAIGHPASRNYELLPHTHET